MSLATAGRPYNSNREHRLSTITRTVNNTGVAINLLYVKPKRSSRLGNRIYRSVTN